MELRDIIALAGAGLSVFVTGAEFYRRTYRYRISSGPERQKRAYQDLKEGADNYLPRLKGANQFYYSYVPETRDIVRL